MIEYELNEKLCWKLYFCLLRIEYNIIFFSLLDSDWLKSVPINP